MTRVPKITAITLLVLVLVIMTAIGTMAGTDAGTRWLVSELGRVLPGSLAAENLAGNLLAGMTASRITYTTAAEPAEDFVDEPTAHDDATITVAVDNATLEIGFWELLDIRLAIQRLLVEALTITIRSGTGETSEEPFSGFSMPIAIRVDRFEAARLDIVRDTDATELTDATLTGEMVGDQLTIDRATLTTDGFAIEFAGNSQFQTPFPLDLSVDWSTTPGFALGEVLLGPASGSGTLRGSLLELAIQHEIQHQIEHDAVQSNTLETITIEAVLASALEAPTLDATVGWNRIVRSFDGLGQVDTENGRATIVTDFSSYRAKIDADVTLADYPSAHIDATFSGAFSDALSETDSTIDLEALLLSSAAGQLVISGLTEIGTNFRTQLLITGRDIDPAEFHSSLSGRIDVAAALSARSLNDMTLTINRADGDFLGYALRGDAVAHWRDQVIEIETVNLATAGNVVNGSGRVFPDLSAEVDVDVDDLAALWPTLRGSLSGQARVAGATNSPRISAALEAENVGVDNIDVGQVSIHGESSEGGLLEWNVTAQSVAIDGFQIGDVAAQLVGSIEAHVFDLDWNREESNLSLQSRGGWQDGKIDHLIERGFLQVGTNHNWSLEQPTRIRAQPDNVEIDAQCWVDREARVCVDASTVSAERTASRLSIENLPLTRFEQVLDEDLRLSGIVDADIALTLSADGVTGHVDWNQRDTEISYQDVDGRIVKTRFGAITLAGEATGDVARATLAARSDEGANIEGNVLLSDAASLDGELSGAINLEFPDIAMLVPLLTRFIELDNARGKFTIELEIGGTLVAPMVKGTSQITDAAASVPSLGIDLDDIQIELVGDAGGVVDVTGSARSGDGSAALTGSADLFNPDGWTADLNLVGDNFEAVRFTERRMRISPNMHARISSSQIQVEGQVVIPFARIELEELPDTVVTPSSDVVIHGAPLEDIDEQAIDVIGKLRLILGDNVRFKGFGLDTGLEGELVFDQQRARAIRGDGRLSLVEGRFSSFGLDLNIDRGTLIFSGPLDNPALNVRATRTVTYDGRDIIAGVMLTGRAATMETRVFTEPGSSEIDALSYLIVGRPAYAESSGTSSGDVTAAALSLGLQQALPFTRTQTGVGLEEIGIEGGDEDRSVVAGIRLSDDLSLRYHYGLFNRLGTILVRYRLSRGLSIEAGSGEVQSLDLIYSIDR